MKQLIKTGRFLYGFGIFVVGMHQFTIRDFRPEILSPFPAWAHTYLVFSMITGIALAVAGIAIASAGFYAERISILLGYFFLTMIITSHLPYILFFSPVKPTTHLEAWFGAGEALAYSGGAFVMAGSFSGKPIPAGRIFFSILIILFGFSHFVFTDAVSAMIPGFFGFPLFWTYLAGTALILSGIAIIFKVWIRTVALLLAILLLLFFIFFHLPDAMHNPSAGHGNEIVRAIIALLFCGIALVIAATDKHKNRPSP